MFLLNPAGVMFGPNAYLDVSGSFYASTANYLKLADGPYFYAAPGPDDVQLTSAPPAAFGFVSPAPQAVTVDGAQLGVLSGKTIGLAGGMVSVVNGVSLSAPDGSVDLAGAASVGEIKLDGIGSTPGFQSTAPVLGDVTVDASAVFVDGARGGGVFIRGGPRQGTSRHPLRNRRCNSRPFRVTYS